jgi:extracellular elastinolytic metalloproteinase
MPGTHISRQGSSSGWRTVASVRWATLLVVLLTAMSAAEQREQSAGSAQLDEGRNLDARPAQVGLPQEPLAAQSAEVGRLVAQMPDLRVEFDPQTGATRSLWNMGGFLTPPDARIPLDIAADYLSGHATLLGLEASDLTDMELTDSVRSSVSGVTHLYFRQRLGGIPAYNAQLQVHVTPSGQILIVNNGFLPGLAEAVAALMPGIDAATAVVRAGEHLGVTGVSRVMLQPADGLQQTTEISVPGLSTEPVKAALMILPIQKGEARLVWNFQIYTLDDQHAFDFTVDAATGQVWTRFDWVASDQYRVYPIPVESPNHSSPPSPADGRALAVNPADPTASPFAWHDTNGVAGAEFTTTQGNNVHAYTDTDGNGVPDAGSSPDCGAGLVCDFALDLTQAPATYRPAAVANLFYWNNVVHDVQYRYGFDEAAGNFQVNNYGRGGLGSDDVRAEAQDGGGLNNANFFTPVDGQRPRMQMYLWNTTTPNRDGDLDAGIIVHEYGHGISNRQVGGPAVVTCLQNQQQPGEGISDWLTLVYTALSSHTATLPRGVGTYALGQPVTGTGIRPLPYTTDNAVNNWTYESISGSVSVPHGVGAIWAQGMWEVYWALVNQHGFSPDLHNATGGFGNQRAMLYHNEGLQLSACSPGFTQLRDAIIQAAQVMHGGEDVCRLWSAFAGFGLGSDAVNPNSNSRFGVVNGFDVPAACNVPTPTATDDSFATAVDTVLTVAPPGVLANDDSQGGGAITAQVAGEPANGTVVLNANGGFTYTPDAGFIGLDTFTYRAVNGMVVSAEATVRVTVGSPPTTTNDSYSTPFDNVLTVAAPGVLGNDNPNGGGAMTAQLVSGPASGTLALNSNGSFTYTPAAGFTGNASFVYRAVSVGGNGNDATVTITVNPPPPTTTNDSYSTPFDTVLTVAAPGVLANDTSNGGGAMTAQLVSGPAGGTLALAANGGLTYTPATGFAGSVSFVYRAVNAGGSGNDATVTITVNPAAPTTVADAYATMYPTPLNIAAPGVLGNDLTNGGGALTAELVSGVSNGTLALSAGGGVSYTPNFGFAGTDSFTYRAVSAVGPGSVATVTITVDPPTSVQPPFNLRVDAVVGNRVTLRFDTLSIGPQAEFFVLEGGLGPGDVLASIPTLSPYPIFTFVAPTGSFFIRMHGQAGTDKSAASNEVALHVNVPVPPSAPAGLLGLVNGSAIGLSWKNTFEGGSPGGLFLDVSGSITTSIPLGSGDSFAFASVPGGTYTLRLRAVNAGGSSAPSSEVTLTFPGACSGAPETPANFLAYRIGATIYILWDPPASGPAPTGYVLNVTSAVFTGDIPLSGRAISALVPPGVYTVTVAATNACGTSVPTASQTVTIP